MASVLWVMAFSGTDGTEALEEQWSKKGWSDTMDFLGGRGRDAVT